MWESHTTEYHVALRVNNLQVPGLTSILIRSLMLPGIKTKKDTFFVKLKNKQVLTVFSPYL